MILQRARDDLRGAGAVAVDQHDDRQRRHRGRFRREVVLVRVPGAAARVDDHVAARQEAVRDADRLIHLAARVVAQVEDQPLHAAALEPLERRSEIAIGDFGEVAQLDVAGALVDHERALDGRDADLVPFDGQLDQLVEAAALDRHVDRGALRALQLRDRLVAGPALGALAGDLGDGVAAADAAAERRRPFEHGADEDVAVDRLDGDAEAVIVAFLALAHLGVAARIEEARMRIERVQQPVDRRVDQAIGFDRPDVLGFDRGQRRGEDAVARLDFVLGGEEARAEQAAGERCERHGSHHRRPGSA